eukprot:CAMPEP_0177589450 /NCGR_PEP_ID=MMETSP0419_2-20121207/6813_1 /TAXON_ID=582737 /ORGANISM="Tetraselmis sp., Strain GSL018" /LENGTH=107 /DNA_ID=CAMNT_0019079811 /DNA_START=326 /DNA_END=650 /DNA_ORIENTATION=+
MRAAAASDQSWPGLHDRGVVMLASGHTLRAKELFEAAKAAIPPRQQEHAVLSPMTMKQAAADVSMGLGQTYMIEKKWDNAEEHLSEVVSVFRLQWRFESYYLTQNGK